jgi:hypothetical protein
MPGAMIRYDDDFDFSGFDYNNEAADITASVNTEGNVTLFWPRPKALDINDSYSIFRAEERDGFNNGSAKLVGKLPYGKEFWIDPYIAFTGKPYYYIVVPVNRTGIRGPSTYSIGIWTEEFNSQYDTIGLPLKMTTNHSANWYCQNIPEAIGINFYSVDYNMWIWHRTSMPEGAFDTDLLMTEGYQISTSETTKFTFIGV